MKKHSERSTPTAKNKRGKIDPSVSPIAFLNMARQYARAATELLSVRQRDAESPNEVGITEPTYFVCSHAMELALKAFLRAHGRLRGGHKLAPLFDECRRLGLVVGADDATDIGNVVSLLDSGNEDYAFRYFNLKSMTTANLEWAVESAEALIRAIARAIETPADRIAGPAVKGTFTWGRPVPRDTPKQS